MRRWNGWGDVSIHYPLSGVAQQVLKDHLGEGLTLADTPLEAILPHLPPPNLPAHPFITVDPLQRLLHARGQSLPDWIALRSGRIGAYPHGIAYPSSDEEVRQVLRYAREVGAMVIPYGGGTSVVGHINPLPDTAPVLTVDLSRMSNLLNLDTTSLLAEFQAGVRGPHIEAQLNAQGFTLGHFPQSFELSTLGGWIATRSSGQQSLYYGRIENLFAGGHLETPLGSLDLPPFPASAAGPDLRQLVLGSEGRLGILTRAVVRVRPLPEAEAFYGVFFPQWENGVQAVRALVQEGLGLSMLRLSNAVETQTTLALSGKDRLVPWLERGLKVLGYGAGRCLLIFGVTGTKAAVGRLARQATALCRKWGGLFTGSLIGHTWRKSRFLTPYLRNTLWELGYATDTLETAVPWSSVEAMTAALMAALTNGLQSFHERVLAFAHLSHVYRDGASIYATYLFRRSGDPDQDLARWQTLKASASQAILAHGGTISHQHGVGLDHAPYLQNEKGALGMEALQAVCRAFDPQGMMNPGKLLAQQ
ncbi:MAG: FAD-binding oxidoreductase [Anaerolineae bacterium]|jgi:alkyldihydroxyacetonephosphate synthase|nr:MAG: FAD-binding oxidoreductase [Anaerolineae bacterium]